MLRGIVSAFQAIDLFGKQINLNFNGKSRAKTRTGGIFSLLFFAFAVWSVYHVSQDLFLHRNPITLSSEFFSENPEEMTLSPKTFTFSFGVQDPDTYVHYIDESVYSLVIQQEQLRRVVNSNGTVDLVWTINPIETEKCTLSHFGALGSKFSDLELDQLYCFKPSETDLGHLRIQGVFESPIHERLTISIKECDVNKRACAPEEKRKRLLEGGWFAVYFTNLAFDPRDYENPSVRYRDSTFTTFGKNYYKEVTVLLNHVQVTSDPGWLTREQETKNYIKYGSDKEMFNFRSDLDEFFKLTMKVDKITIKHDRSYIKLQDILAEVNGLVTIGILVAVIIIAPYSNIKFYEGLINELFDIKMLKGKYCRKKRSLSEQLSLSHQINTYVKPVPPQSFIKNETKKDTIADDNPEKPLKNPNDHKVNNIELGKITFTEKIEKDHEEKKMFPKTSIFDTPVGVGQEKGEKILSKTFDGKKINDIERKAGSSLVVENDDEANQGKEIKLEFSEQNEFKDLKGKDSNEELQRRQSLLSDVPLNPEIKSGMSVKKLKQDVPKAVESKLELLENYDNHKESVEIIVESLIFNQGEKKQTKEEKIENNVSKIENDEKEKGVEEKDRREEITIKSPKAKDLRSLEPFSNSKINNLVVQDPVKIHLTFWEYIQSYIWRSDKLKEKLSVLKEGRRRIDERLDVFNIFKKLRELDKLKVLLLENEQLVLFDGLPKPELVSKSYYSSNQAKSLSRHLLKEAKFISERRKNDLIAISYENLKQKPESTLIDRKLLDIYDDMLES